MMANKKAELRKRFRRERQDRFIPASFSLLLSAPEIKSAKIIATYISRRDEPDTEELNHELLKRGINLILPRVDGKVLQWVEWSGDASTLVEAKGLLEPIGPPLTDISSIDVVIVPALHIDRDGYRLGQGGGFYDRALVSMPGWKVGLVHSGEITGEPLPREEHDVRLSAAATPDLIVRFTR
ncbi:MAG: 5-formyltetrahydrofolate cyclo-ligase [Actinomycetota bacterium]